MPGIYDGCGDAAERAGGDGSDDSGDPDAAGEALAEKTVRLCVARLAGEEMIFEMREGQRVKDLKNQIVDQLGVDSGKWIWLHDLVARISVQPPPCFPGQKINNRWNLTRPYPASRVGGLYGVPEVRVVSRNLPEYEPVANHSDPIQVRNYVCLPLPNVRPLIGNHQSNLAEGPLREL